MSELKPCPFCGGEAEYSVIDSRQEIPFGTVHHFVSCKNHCIEGLYSRGESKEDVIKAWNKRSNWHTGTPTEGGFYLVYYLRQPFPNEKESVELYHQLLSPNSKDGYIKWIDIDGEVVFGEEEVVRWQKIEPYKEASE